MSTRLDQIPAESRRALEEAGYLWEPTSGIWVNRALGRAISHEAVREHGAAWLRRWLEEA